MGRIQRRVSGYFAACFVMICLLGFSDVMSYADELPASRPSCITCKGSLSPQGRWCNNHNGTVTDMSNGLIWLSDAAWGGMYPLWSEELKDTAFDRVSQVKNGNPVSLTDGSDIGDWGLPTSKQLKSLVTGTEAISLSNVYFFAGVMDNVYWSSTVYAHNASIGYHLSFDDCLVHPAYKWTTSYVWPVRR
ncbi:MAG: DUF1566 domain-containing protein [Deltaproteobacteria bacterium]|nr:DUF1566 domain-containing protein [Deltaproteobacteria bacterium]